MDDLIVHSFHLTHITFVGSVVKTEDQNESAIHMYDEAFPFILHQDFSAVQKANERSEAVRRLTEEPDETDSDASTEIDEDYSPPARASFSGQ